MFKNLEYCVAFSKNEDDRYRASSGGVGTALVRHLMSQGVYGTSVTLVFDSSKCMYVPKLIFSEAEINVCGSVYQDIDIVLFIKKNLGNIKNGIVLTCAPCQVVAIRTILDRMGIKNFIISYCCSGQTTVEGTWCYYRMLGIEKKNIVNMQYRGNGWPSGIQIWLKDGSLVKKDNWTEPWISIFRSNLFRPKKCFFCKLDMGKNADVNLADPWLKEYILNERVGATLCTICSRKGYDVLKEMESSNEIAVMRSSYDEYSIAEQPNVQKELFLKIEMKYRRWVARLVNVSLYRNVVTKSSVALNLHNRMLALMRFCLVKRNVMGRLFSAVKSVKRKLRVFFCKRKIGCFDGNFSIGENVVMQNPHCIFLGKNVGIGDNSFFGPVTSFLGVTYNPKILVGENTWIGKYSSIAAINRVEIGRNVLFAGFVHITDHSHGYENIATSMMDQPLISKGPVVIEDDCWLGYNCEILSGVHIGKHCVVAARAVVTKDVPAYCVVAGNPARIVKKYDEEKKTWIRVEKK